MPNGLRTSSKIAKYRILELSDYYLLAVNNVNAGWKIVRLNFLTGDSEYEFRHFFAIGYNSTNARRVNIRRWANHELIAILE